MKLLFTLVSVVVFHISYAQVSDYEQQRFCKNLNQVFDSGRKENFESITGTNTKQSPFLPVPGYSIKLEPFGIIYVDKDSRFVGKTNQNMDTLSALRQMEEMKRQVNFCLDSTQWKWSEQTGNDSTTVFFHEVKQFKASSKDLNLWLAMVKVADKTFTVSLYIRRRK